MPTVIDSLVVQLGLDSKDMASKSPQAVKNLKDIEQASGKTELSITSLSKGLAGLLTVIGGTVAIKAFISDFIETNAQLDRFSRNLGLSVSTISAWSQATERLGGSSAGLQGTLDMLSQSQTELITTGNSSLIPFLSALGISLLGVGGKARPVDEILLDLSSRFEKMDRTTANNLGRRFGIDQGTLNLLLEGRKELELTLRRQREYNAVTKQQAEEATRLQKRLVDVKQGLAAYGRALLIQAAPAIEYVLDIFKRLIDWIQTNGEAVGDFLKIVAVGLGAIALASLPIDLTVAAVLALAAAFALLWQDYSTWKRGGDSLFDWTLFAKGIDIAGNAVKYLSDQLERLIEFYKKLYTSNPNLPGNVMLQGAKDTLGRLFNRSGKPVIAGGTGASIASPNLNAAQIKEYFQKQGWAAEQAAGIAANLLSESSGKPGAIGDSGSAFGLAQWHSDRQAAFAKWAGHDIRNSTAAEQLAFVQYELTQGSETTAGKALRGATTASQAGSIVSSQYERPRDTGGEAARRGTYAQSLLGIPGASGAAAGASQGSSGSGSIDNSKSLTVGEVKVYSSATDAKGIAGEYGEAFDYLFTSQANTGLN